MTRPPIDLDFSSIAAQAPVAWAVVDLDGNLLDANRAYADLFAYDLEDLLELTAGDLTHPDDRPENRAVLDRLVTQGLERDVVDKRYVRRDGSEFVGNLTTSILRDTDGHPIALIGILVDVTEARALAATVAHNEDRLSKMLTNISETVTLVGEDGSIQATTGFDTQVMGYSRDFWRSRSIFDMVHPHERERVGDMAAAVLAMPGKQVTDEFRLIHRYGHYEDVEVTAVNLLADPAVGAIVLTSRNITERKAAERAMVEMRDEALRLAEQRVAFVANVSHELRTPIHAVMGLAELLGDGPLDPSQRAQVAAIETEARHLQTTVDDLLDHVRIEANGLTLEPGATDLGEVIRRVVARAASTAHARGLELSSEVDRQVPRHLLLDEHRVEQVLTNLVGNAVKFTSTGSVRLTASTSGADLVMSVIDTGPGIPAEELSAVFEPFHQVPGTGTSGSGLGLALVAGLVRLMGGRVEVSSEPGRGSTFTVVTPLVVTDRPPAPEIDAPVLEPARQASILVVEDTSVNQMLIAEQLRRLGHRCTIVASGAECLAVIDGPEEFDVVLMDWQLPDIDGLEVTRRIRAAGGESDRRIPIVAVTASAMPEDPAACRAAGMDDFLAKPVSLRSLDLTIRRWVGGGDARADGQAPDVSRLDALADELGDVAPIVRLVEQYLEELQERSRAIDAAANEGDLDRLGRVGHTLRSTSDLIGATELAVACRGLERATRADEVLELLPGFAVAVSTTQTMLETWLTDHGGPS